MPKQQQMQMQENNNYKMYFWTLVIVLVLLGGVYMLKKTGKLMLGRLDLQKESQTVQSDTIDSKSELKDESMKLDETDVDGSVDAQLDLLQKDAVGL